MITLKIDRFSRFFFDRETVIKAAGKVKAKNLSRAGAFIRTKARSLLRRRKKTSSPGSPPSVHAPSGAYASLKNILFGWEPTKETVVVGPVKTNQKDFLNGEIAAGTVPNLHEFGGTRKVIEVQSRRGGEWFRLDRRRSLREGQVTRGRSATYPPRPFMGPALASEIEAGHVSAVWKDSIRGT